MSNWTDELKQQAVDIYTSEIEKYDSDEDKAKFSMEIVKTIAEELEKPVNGVRLILNKAGVYIKATPTKAKASGTAKGTSTRVNKAEAIQALKNHILSINGNDESGLDHDILDKLTGKAAVYFTGVLQNVVSGE